MNPFLRFRRCLRPAIVAFLGYGFMMVVTAHAQEVLPLTWPTRHAAPPASADPGMAVYLSVMRASVKRLPEAAVVKLALTQSAVLGVSSADAAKLDALVARRYAAIAESPVFKHVASPLPYCLSETRPKRGLALLYRPARTDATTPVLLFVHGYGGSFLWYQHQLAEWFPGHIIVCPAYGIDPSDIPAAYLQEAVASASAKLGHAFAKPTLMGISAGGFGACRVYARTPAPYQQLAVLAAYPPDESFRAWPKSARSGWLVGAEEYYVKDGGFSAYAKSLAARSSRFQSVVIPGADHSFFLTHPAETRRALQQWLK